MTDHYPRGTIIRVVKPLYGIIKAGIYWFTIYQGHYITNRDIRVSTFDSYLFIIISGLEYFAIVGIETDDTLDLNTVL